MRLFTLAFLCLLVASSAFAVEPPDGNWKQLEVDGILVFTDANAGRAESIARQISALRRSLQAFSMLDVEGGRQIRLFVFNNWESFQPYVSRYNGKPRPLAGYTTQNDESILMAVMAHYPRPADASGYDGFLTPFEVICHEYVHAFLAERAPQTPLWLNEGLAEFFSTYRLDGDVVYLGEPAYRHVKFLEREHRALSLERMLMIERGDREYNEGNRAGFYYAQVWATTHYLMTDKARRNAMKQFLRDVHAGMPEVAALNRDLLEYLPDQGPEIRAYAGQDHLPYFKLPIDQEAAKSDVAKSDPDDETLLLHFGDLMTGLGPDYYPDARAHFTAVLDRDPGSVDARMGLARMALYTSDFASAKSELESALEIEADHPGANGMLGYVLVRQYDTERGAEAWTGAEEFPESIHRAREALALSRTDDQLDPWASFAYAMTFLGVEDPGPGIEVLAQAIDGAPWIHELFELMVWLQCRAGDLAEARRVYDVELRPRTRNTERAEVEAHLVTKELNAALAFQKEGRSSEAADLLFGAVEATERDSIRDLVAEQALQLGLDRAYRQYIDVVRLSRVEHYQEALATLEAIVAPDGNPAFLERLETRREELVLLAAAQASRG